jgi:hypothetical protein
MQTKRVLIPERLRKPTRQFGFGWIDRRLLHEGYLSRCDSQALALYLLLVIVADAQGLSFYAQATLERLLSMPPGAVAAARANLIGAGLIAYRAPIYQVLSLDPPSPPRVPGLRSVGITLQALQRQRPRGKASEPYVLNRTGRGVLC